MAEERGSERARGRGGEVGISTPPAHGPFLPRTFPLSLFRKPTLPSSAFLITAVTSPLPSSCLCTAVRC